MLGRQGSVLFQFDEEGRGQALPDPPHILSPQPISLQSLAPAGLLAAPNMSQTLFPVQLSAPPATGSLKPIVVHPNTTTLQVPSHATRPVLVEKNQQSFIVIPVTPIAVVNGPPTAPAPAPVSSPLPLPVMPAFATSAVNFPATNPQSSSMSSSSSCCTIVSNTSHGPPHPFPNRVEPLELPPLIGSGNSVNIKEQSDGDSPLPPLPPVKRPPPPTVPLAFPHEPPKAKKAVLTTPKTADEFVQSFDQTDAIAQKPYACNICHRRYKRERGLQRHKRIHDNSTPGCPICGKKFARKTYLQDHIRTHTGEKPFECEFCGKRFPAKRNLDQHLLIHSPEKKHECMICHRRFRLRRHLRHHVKNLHKKKT